MISKNLNWFAISTGVLYFIAGVQEMFKHNTKMGVVYCCYALASIMLGTSSMK